jgi:hypothetical protein
MASNYYGDDPYYEQNQSQPQVQPTKAQTNPWDANAFKQVVGRDANQAEIDYYSKAGDGWLDEVKRNTPGYGQAPAAPAAAPWNLNSWADQQLDAVQSTDDRNYWYGKLAADPKAASGDQSALGYWSDRIRRGNGSSLVKNGSLSLFNDGPTGGSQPPPQAAHDPRADELYNTLLARSQQSLAVDRTNPAVRSQADANAAATDRSARNYLADLAEKAGPLANLQGETRLVNERAGQSEGAFESTLVGNEINARRQEIQNALSQMGSMLTSQQQMSLQEELARLNDATQRYGISSSADQFSQSLAQRKNEFSQTNAFNYANMDEQTRRMLLQLLGQ